MTTAPAHLTISLPTNPGHVMGLALAIGHYYREGLGIHPSWLAATLRDLSSDLAREAERIALAHDNALEEWRDEIDNLLGPDD